MDAHMLLHQVHILTTLWEYGIRKNVLSSISQFTWSCTLYLVIWPNLDVDIKESKECEHYFKLKIGVSVTKEKEENDISIDN